MPDLSADEPLTIKLSKMAKTKADAHPHQSRVEKKTTQKLSTKRRIPQQQIPAPGPITANNSSSSLDLSCAKTRPDDNEERQIQTQKSSSLDVSSLSEKDIVTRARANNDRLRAIQQSRDENAGAKVKHESDIETHKDLSQSTRKSKEVVDSARRIKQMAIADYDEKVKEHNELLDRIHNLKTGIEKFKESGSNKNGSEEEKSIKAEQSALQEALAALKKKQMDELFD